MISRPSRRVAIAAVVLVACTALRAAARLGYPRYDRAMLLETTSETSANVSCGDMDGDGKPDIIVANRNGRSPGFNYICLKNGNDTFGADCIGFSSEPSTTIIVADVNGDGIPGLLVPHRNGGQSRLYFGSKGGDLAHLASVTFGPPEAQIRFPSATAYGIAVGDFNKDGRPDIAVARSEAPNVLYFASGTVGKCK
jgi:hypothetical protein